MTKKCFLKQINNSIIKYVVIIMSIETIGYLFDEYDYIKTFCSQEFMWLKERKDGKSINQYSIERKRDILSVNESINGMNGQCLNMISIKANVWKEITFMFMTFYILLCLVENYIYINC